MPGQAVSNAPAKNACNVRLPVSRNVAAAHTRRPAAIAASSAAPTKVHVPMFAGHIGIIFGPALETANASWS